MSDGKAFLCDLRLPHRLASEAACHHQRMPERLVIVIFPDARTTVVEDFRARWDPLAPAVKAHITLVYPFTPQLGHQQLHDAVTAVAGQHTAFAVRLGAPMTWEDEYLFLQATEGGQQIMNLHNDLHHRLRLAPPPRFVAHMTVARQDQAAHLGLALAQAQQGGLSVAGFARMLTVYRISADGERITEFQAPLLQGPR